MGVDVNSIPFQNVAGRDAARPTSAVDGVAAQRGRELARLQLEEMIDKIRRRAATHNLDRGLALSLPYFDDLGGEVRWRKMEIIPQGRVPFVPAFVVLAARKEVQAVEQDSHLAPSTRAHLLDLLHRLEEAFLRTAPKDGSAAEPGRGGRE